MHHPAYRRRLASLVLVAVALGAAGDLAAEETDLSPIEHFRLRQEAAAHYEAGEWSEAAKLYRHLLTDRPDDPDLDRRLALSLFRDGRLGEALEPGLRAMEAGFLSEARTAYGVAQVHARQGKRAEALDWLERALAAGLEDRPQLADEPAFEALRDDPRFRRLAGLPPAGEHTREAEWHHDLDFYLEEVRRVHAAPSRPAHSPEFEAEVGELAGRVSELSDTEIAVELARITVSLGDGHSVLYPVSTERVDFPQLPLVFYFFPEGLYVVDAAAEHAELVGRRVVALGGRSVEGLPGELAPWVPQDNEQGILWLGPRVLATTPFLQALGYTQRLDRVELTLEAEGASRTEVTVGTTGERPSTTLPPPPGLEPSELPLWLRDLETNYWHQPLAGLDALYVQFNQVRDAEEEPIAEYAGRLQEALADTGARHLVVDVRHNNGGNNFLMWPLLRVLVWHELGSPEHRTWILTGRNTFSACQNFVNFAERLTDAVFVGEASSSRPNFTGESNPVELPFSGLSMSISSRYWQDSYPGDDRSAIPVELPVELSAQDYFAGRDPVLDAVKKVLAGKHAGGD